MGRKAQSGSVDLTVRRPSHFLLQRWCLILAACGAQRFSSVAGEGEIFANKLPRGGQSYRVSRLVESAYADFDDMPTYVTQLHTESSGGYEMVIVQDERALELYVIFHGTDTWLGDDGWTDVNVVQDPFGPSSSPVNGAGAVHGGFNDVVFADDLALSITTAVEDKCDDYQLIIGGHGKGGAEAMLMGAYLASELLPDCNVEVITFAQPRVGDEAFMAWVYGLHNLSIYRFCLKDDPVPRLPSSTMALAGSFVDVGHLVQMDDDGTKTYYKQYGEGNKVGIPMEDWEGVANGASNHDISAYVNYLRENRYVHDFVATEGAGALGQNAAGHESNGAVPGYCWGFGVAAVLVHVVLSAVFAIC